MSEDDQVHSRRATAQGILAMCREVRSNVDRIEQEAQALLASLSTGHEGPFEAPVQPSQHLREHRPGRAKKLATDPELRAFVEARLFKMTFDHIANEVALNFPPERQVKRSAIHDWFRKVYKRKYQPDPG
jgi:hypothetical protein